MYYIILNVFIKYINNISSKKRCKKMDKITPNATLDFDSYNANLTTIRNNLAVNAQLSNYPDVFKLNSTDRNAYYAIKVVSSDGLDITVIILKYNLFIQGFIAANNKYYHFNDATIKSLTGHTSADLGFNSNYSGGLAVSGQINLNYSSFNNAIAYLRNYDGTGTMNKSTLVITIFMVSEAIRFVDVKRDIITALETFGTATFLWSAYQPRLVSWQDYSQKALSNVLNNDVKTYLSTAYVA